ncbi:unnamed protein product [Lactuca saligna]|uniref:Uncharacterized protein n=1 Tax=Lactuca saligna TaxID=75948 RepID=A0AA35Z2N1_LACSI|nr:unnamed protein product [Lactuca saligna]
MSGNGRKDRGHTNNSFSGSVKHGGSHNSTEEPRYNMPIVTEVVGFNSHDAEATFQSPQTPYTPLASNMPLTQHGSASRVFQYCRFGDQNIHNMCIHIFWENLDHSWAQFNDIPNKALTQMFSLFRTKYMWHSQENENIFDAFKCVLKGRYRDRMQGGISAGVGQQICEDPANDKDDVDVWEESHLRRKGKNKGATSGIGA